jgi:ABC-type sugar transport system substrate-binding protein
MQEWIRAAETGAGFPGGVLKRLCRAVGAAFVVSVLAFAVSACGSSSSETSGGDSGSSTSGASTPEAAENTEPKTFNVVFYTESIPYFQVLREALETQAKAMGVTIKLTAANFDAAQESGLVDTAITQQPDGIILAPIDATALIQAGKKATDANIPVVLVGDNFAAEGQDAMLTYVGDEMKTYGAQKAEFIAEQIGGKGEVIVIHGPRGLDYVEGQTLGYKEAFAKYPGIKVIEGPYGNFSSEVGLKSLENVLTRNPNPAAVYFDNDDLAMGGISALKARGLKDVITVGSDGGPAAVEAVRKGNLTMTLATRPYATGVEAIKVLVNYLDTKQAPEKLVKVEAAQVTQESLKTLKPDDYR